MKNKNNYFNNIDLNSFWKESEYATENYTSDYPDEAMITFVEKSLGYLNYKLPSSYIALMQQTRNGGIPIKNCYLTTEVTSWAEDHIAITGIYGIGHKKLYSIGGDLGSQFHIKEWGYPPIGIAICNCPGHALVFLDYRKHGSQGEPEVVFIYTNEDDEFKITWLAPNFETFIEGLISHDDLYNIVAKGTAPSN